MSTEGTSTGWILHSFAQGRRFGPMTEDELRQYFRAGMVKSVDRLSAPGETELRPAGEVARSIGENEPVGPPPPEPEETPAPAIPDVARAALASGMTPDPASEERAARAAAALKIDMAAMMASSATPSRRSNMWMIVIGSIALVASLFFALSMAKKMKPKPVDTVESVHTTVVADRGGDAGPAAGVETAVQGAADMSQKDDSDQVFEEHFAKARALNDAKDWAALEVMADAWAKDQADRTEPLQFLGVAQASQGKYELAAQSFEKILAMDPASSVKGMLADTYMQAQQPGKAATLYEQMLKSRPNDARLWNNFGAALNLSAQPTQAITALENAVRLDPSMKQAWTNLGNLYQAQGDQAKAQAAFANAK